jgi:hypothetical protein
VALHHTFARVIESGRILSDSFHFLDPSSAWKSCRSLLQHDRLLVYIKLLIDPSKSNSFEVYSVTVRVSTRVGAITDFCSSHRILEETERVEGQLTKAKFLALQASGLGQSRLISELAGSFPQDMPSLESRPQYPSSSQKPSSSDRSLRSWETTRRS